MAMDATAVANWIRPALTATSAGEESAGMASTTMLQRKGVGRDSKM